MRFELRLHGVTEENRAVFEQLIAWAEQVDQPTERPSHY